MEDIRFAGEQAIFYKSLGGLLTEFDGKIQRLINKQDKTRFKTYPTG